MTDQDDTLRRMLRRIWRQLDRRRRRQFVALFALMLVGAVAEVLSLGAIAPFIAALTRPSELWANSTVRGIAAALGAHDEHALAVLITIVFSALIVISSAVRLLIVYVNARLPFAVGRDFSVAVYTRTLHQPYQVQTTRNSSDVLAAINQVQDVITSLFFTLTLMTSVIVGAGIVLALVIAAPLVALVAGGGFGAIYLVVVRLTRARLVANSQRVARAQPERMSAVQEGLRGIREVIMHDAHAVFCDRFARVEAKMRRAQGTVLIIGNAPRYAVQALGMLLIAWIAFGLTTSAAAQGDVAAALPTLGLLALGAQKLLPSLQNSFSAWARISGQKESVNRVLTLLEQSPAPSGAQGQPEELPLRSAIRLEEVSFRYDPSGEDVIHGVSAELIRGSVTGIVGSTGSGKSTLVDLMMGLLAPDRGQITIDGVPLTAENTRAWQRSISHVPQSVFLIDGTIEENIAFGLRPGEIDHDRVVWAATKARIAEYIETSPDGYASLVGEAGIRLSGGQRQRVSLARALYQGASVLVLDEATSALDNATEHAVMDAVRGLSDDVTVILVAHRLTTVMACDQLLHLERGRLVATGSYEVLMDTDKLFQQLAHTEPLPDGGDTSDVM